MTTHTLKVDTEHSQERLDVYLARTLTEAPSRNFVKKLIDGKHVLVNKHSVKAHYKLHSDDEIEVDIPAEFFNGEGIEPENIVLDIFYEDDHLAVINKPAGMLVHPAQGCYHGTLVNALLYHFKQLSDVNSNFRPGIVHRLDQETSGLMVVAKDNRTHYHLAKQFSSHRVHKRYMALVEGKIEFDEGVVDVPLGRHPYHREKRDVQFTDSAKESLTIYRVLKRHDKVTCVALFPKTGRTHQLRVHMAHLGHPVLGDQKYGKRSNFSRLALHAQSIGFTHPQTKIYIEFSSIPPEAFSLKE